MAIITSYIPIQSNYKGHSLTILNASQKGGLNWDEHPIRITDTEIGTMNFDHVLSIMTKKLKSPSEAAGIPKNEICTGILHLINQKYKDALINYKNDLDKAGRNDLKKWNELKEVYKNTTAKSAAGGGVLGFAVGFGLGGPIGAAIGGSICGVGSGCAAHKLTGDYIERDASAHRIKWLQSIDALEKARYQEMGKEIIKGCMALVREIIYLRNDGEASRDTTKKLRELHKIHQVHFPNEALLVSNVNVKNLLEEIGQQFPGILS